MCRLHKLASHTGFTGSLVPGIHIEADKRREDEMDIKHNVEDSTKGSKSREDKGEDDDNNDDDNDNDAMLAEQIHKFMQISSYA